MAKNREETIKLVAPVSQLPEDIQTREYDKAMPMLSRDLRFRPKALDWFDRQMDALAEFDVTLTFCFTPEHRGIAPHHTSPPLDPEEFADFCAHMISRYCDMTGLSPAVPFQAEPLEVSTCAP